MTTATKEPEVQVSEFESIQKRVEQLCGDISAANQAAEEALNRYRQIPDDETHKVKRTKAVEVYHKHQEDAESLRKGFSLEEAAVFLEGALEKTRALRQEFESMRNQAEQTVREIAAANKEANEQLEQYRSYLYDGEKQKADRALELVNENRKKAKALTKKFPKLLPELDCLRQRLEDLRLQECAFSSIGVLLNIQARLKMAFTQQGRVLNECSHTQGELRNLEEFIKKQS